MKKEIKRKWIEHTLRKCGTNITCPALQWTPQGKRKRGRPRPTWRRVLEKEMAEKGHTGTSSTNYQRTKRSGKELSVAYAPEGSEKGLSQFLQKIVTVIQNC